MVYSLRCSSSVSLSTCRSLHSSRTFTKIFIEVIAILRLREIRISHFLDNVLLQSQEQILQHRQLTLAIFHKYGWLNNREKSLSSPRQDPTSYDLSMSCCSARTSQIPGSAFSCNCSVYKVLFSPPHKQGDGTGCSLSTMAFSSSVCIPASTAHTSKTSQDRPRGSVGYSHHTLVAEKTLVSPSTGTPQSLRSLFHWPEIYFTT